MREFVVTLRCGLRFVVKADRVAVLDHQYLALRTGDGSDGEVVALFERSQVAVAVAKDRLVSEERCEPIPGPFTTAGEDIPF